ncbi:MAG: D-arabinono-1,4-lactone oxidase [Solirubrobacteraceae bacterium]
MNDAAVGRNWAGNYRYGAAGVHRPQRVEQVQELVAGHPRARALGTRHSFTGIGDSAVLISLAELETEIAVDRPAGLVAVPGGVTYAELADTLNRHRLALANLASLPHISVAGAVSTATHGSGDAIGNLATAVVELELVTGEGTLMRVRRGEPDFPGVVVGLGALGVVTELTLAVEPYYELSQCVYEGLRWETLLAQFDEITAAGESVSVFHGAGEQTEQLWVKRRVGDLGAAPEQLFGAQAATAPRNPVPGSKPANCTDQLGVPGPWSERLPHFRSGFTPSAGEEIQSELLVPREHAPAAIEVMLGLAEQIRPLLLVGELRTVAADELWLSPQYAQATVGLHFTWRRQPEAVTRAVGTLERVLAPLGARPHWGKLFTAGAREIAPLYPRLADFLQLRARLDPRGVFVNEWLQTHVLGDP